jgi:D-xylose 1-dehydrogenase (NADP+, D-xylono-1,5-lactone-forming)
MKTVRFGVLGAARINQNVVPAMHAAEGVEPVALAARDLERAQTMARALEIPHVFSDYESLLESDVDAVYIPLPNHLHATWAMAALNAGKHVLLEKPLAMNPLEVQRIFDLAKEKNLVVMEGFMYRHHPQHALALEHFRSGAIGKLRLIRSSFSFQLQQPGDYRWIKSLGGGALLDLGCYCINAALLFAEAMPSSAVARASLGGEPNQALAELVDLDCAAILEFDTLRAVFDCSFRQPLRQQLELVGERGIIEIPQFVFAKDDAGLVVVNGQEYTTAPVNQYQRMLEHFARVMRGLEPMRFDGLDRNTNPVNQARVIEMVQRAAGLL